ncbi:anomalous homeobox protein-like [Mauremys mutica]|uniref:anomalous homeobox protein-like n=1 Tax=Mauremys mutica TaxID=74926 RepID=UPI001D169414|nr:anomalous homeobox protein-like [Mauremys mutica]
MSAPRRYVGCAPRPGPALLRGEGAAAPAIPPALEKRLDKRLFQTHPNTSLAVCLDREGSVRLAAHTSDAVSWLYGRGVWTNVSMKRFMALLSKNENKDPPQAKLLDLAGQLCGDVQSVSPSLEKLVEAMMGCKLQEYFLTNISVVRACVLVLIHRGQHDTACRLLECCRVKEKEELVQLWNEIHYHKDMEKHHTDSLTSVQKFRCRKRNPPPVSLCPEGTTNRNHPEKVRQTLQRFAANVTMYPNKNQRDTLAQDTNLKPIQVYNWFANYRRRQGAQLRRLEELISSTDEEPSTRQAKHQYDSAAGVRASMSRDPGGGCIEASSESISHQADLELESFVLREGQLGSLEAILPHSSPQAVLDKSQCPPVSTSHLEEIQALGHSQVLENPLVDPMTDNRLWAAWLLLEFSAGGRM